MTMLFIGIALIIGGWLLAARSVDHEHLELSVGEWFAALCFVTGAVAVSAGAASVVWRTL